MVPPVTASNDNAAMNVPAQGSSLLTMIAPRVLAQADRLRDGFPGARPFAHCVIEDFFTEAFARSLLDAFPAFERGNSLNEDGLPGGKSVVEQMQALGDAYARLDQCVQSTGFLELIGRITGIPDLLYDPWYFGGGTHENRDGQSLDNHIDFNYHPGTGWHRRLNLIVYLNPEWEVSWGGALELHRDPYDPEADEVASIVPSFNRCVIFETTEHSWHGFPRITLPADRPGLSRKSIALYFYTRDRPREQTAQAHSTIYVDQALPAHFKPGRVLSERDCVELHDLIDRSSSHNRRLYGEISRLQSELGKTPLSRIVRGVRRLLARGRLR